MTFPASRTHIANAVNGVSMNGPRLERFGHVRQRLTEIGGRYEFDSVIGQGTTVRLTLPLGSTGRPAPNLTQSGKITGHCFSLDEPRTAR